LYLGKHGQKPKATRGVAVARSAEGDKPAGIVVEAVDVSARVKRINMIRRTVTLQLPDGRRVTTKADKSIKAFDTLRRGDVIRARYTEAIAISVEKP
jgi:hypothetical protein